MNFIHVSPKLRIAFILILAILVVGTSGFMIIEGYGLLDSVYMTIITVATVGFREIRELSDGGKLFTIFLITTSLGTFAFAVSTITTDFIEGQFSYFFQRRKLKIDKNYMKGHIIVCGFGRNGRQTVNELIQHNHPYVIIENSSEVINRPENQNFNFILGDATTDETLEKAAIHEAAGLITTMPVDADNLFVVISARTLNQKLKIISRATNESTEKKLKQAGANNVIMPEKVGGSHMGALVLKPDIVEFLEHIQVKDDMTNLEEIMCSNLPKDLQNKSLFELGIRQKTGVNIIGFKNPDGEYIINPHPDIKMIQNSKIFVLGTPEQINKMKTLFKTHNNKS